MTRAELVGAASLVAGASLIAGVSCVPAVGTSDATITSPRILAVRADPAEAPPGTRVAFAALVAGPAGTVTDAAIDWSFCTAPRTLTDDEVVASACLGSSSLVAAGAGPHTAAVTPANGCSLFGPDAPAAALRPEDPDPTGGYFQPLRADLAGSDSAFELARIQCQLESVDAATAAAFTTAYHLNQNPQLLPLAATRDGATADLAAIPGGSRVVLEASWPASSAETFAYLDPSTQNVTSQREAIEVAWYATGGTFDSATTGRAATDAATASTNGWQAPSGPGTVHAWVVLRDSRGGVDFASVDFVVVASP